MSVETLLRSAPSQDRSQAEGLDLYDYYLAHEASRLSEPTAPAEVVTTADISGVDADSSDFDLYDYYLAHEARMGFVESATPEDQTESTFNKIIAANYPTEGENSLPEIYDNERSSSNGKKILAFLGLTGAITIAYLLAPVDKTSNPSTANIPAETVPEDILSTTATIVPEAPPTTIPMADKPFEIIPPENFLTPEGDFVKEDYRITIPSIDASIIAFVRPESERDYIGELDKTVIDTVRLTDHPTRVTPQVAAHKLIDVNFIPTAERKKRSNGDMWYWNDKSAGEFQKVGMFTQYPDGSIIYPGQLGNSVLDMHGSTKTAGGGDFPAMNIGDILELSNEIDGNKYTFEYLSREIIDVDANGALTPAETAKQRERGYGANVNMGEVIHNYLEVKDVPTLTVVICSDLQGTPGGENGKNAGDARALYRFKLIKRDIKLLYPSQA